MTIEQKIGMQFAEIWFKLLYSKNTFIHTRFLFLEQQINPIFKNCNKLISKNRVEQLEKIGFKRKQLYRKTRKLQELRTRSGDVVFDYETYTLKIFLSEKKYNLDYLEINLNEIELPERN